MLDDVPTSWNSPMDRSHAGGDIDQMPERRSDLMSRAADWKSPPRPLRAPDRRAPRWPEPIIAMPGFGH